MCVCEKGGCLRRKSGNWEADSHMPEAKSTNTTLPAHVTLSFKQWPLGLCLHINGFFFPIGIKKKRSIIHCYFSDFSIKRVPLKRSVYGPCVDGSVFSPIQ